MTGHPLDHLPLAALFLLGFGIIFSAIEVGFRVGSRRTASGQRVEPGPVGAVVGAVLGLLAFMVALTFSMAASRYDHRKSLLLDEVNAIDAAYLRAGLLPEPQRSESRKLLREYVTLRADAVAIVREPGGLERMARTSEDLQTALWSEVESLYELERVTPAYSLFASALNDLNRLHRSRLVFAAQYRIPSSVWIVLAAAAVVAMTIVGFQFGLSGRRSLFATTAIATIFSAVFLLIADLDRPLSGLLAVSQQPMVELATRLERMQN